MAVKHVPIVINSKNSSPSSSIETDPLSIRRILSKATDGRAQASLKVRGSERLLRTQVMSEDALSAGLHLQCSLEDHALNPENLRQLFDQNQTQECMILIYLQGRSIIGITAPPSKITQTHIVFEPPKKLFKVQRRKHVRYIIPSGYEFTIEFESLETRGKKVKKKLVDMSESGLSFSALSPREALYYKKGLIIPHCLIRMQNQEISVSLRVRNQSPIFQNGISIGTKIGTEFEAISEQDQNYLAQLVYAHAAHLFY